MKHETNHNRNGNNHRDEKTHKRLSILIPFMFYDYFNVSFEYFHVFCGSFHLYDSFHVFVISRHKMNYKRHAKNYKK